MLSPFYESDALYMLPIFVLQSSFLVFSVVYPFPVADFTNYHKLGGKTTEIYPLTSMEARIQSWQGHTPAEGSRGDFLLLLVSDDYRYSLSCDSII